MNIKLKNISLLAILGASFTIPYADLEVFSLGNSTFTLKSIDSISLFNSEKVAFIFNQRAERSQITPLGNLLKNELNYHNVYAIEYLNIQDIDKLLSFTKKLEFITINPYGYTIDFYGYKEGGLFVRNLIESYFYKSINLQKHIKNAFFFGTPHTANDQKKSYYYFLKPIGQEGPKNSTATYWNVAYSSLSTSKLSLNQSNQIIINSNVMLTNNNVILPEITTFIQKANQENQKQSRANCEVEYNDKTTADALYVAPNILLIPALLNQNSTPDKYNLNWYTDNNYSLYDANILSIENYSFLNLGYIIPIKKFSKYFNINRLPSAQEIQYMTSTPGPFENTYVIPRELVKGKKNIVFSPITNNLLGTVIAQNEQETIFHLITPEERSFINYKVLSTAIDLNQ